ncbi:MAG: hypothetical protein M3256_03180 [Actinomycetota bacterium]|nr:hypothetical protein [Actinomycetota bacterium]
MDGEEFLRGWAAAIVSARDTSWHQRFYALVGALELAEAIKIDTARSIGQELRSGLASVVGEETSDVFLRSLRPAGSPPSSRPVGFAAKSPRAAVSVRSTFAELPEGEGHGGTDFVSVADGAAVLMCSGPGQAPWREHPLVVPPRTSSRGMAVQIGTTLHADVQIEPTGPPSPPFLGVTDNHGRSYQLSAHSHGTSSSGAKRQRWDLLAQITPLPPADIDWLELSTAHGVMRAPLRPPLPVTVTVSENFPSPTSLDRHLRKELHQQVWLHLLDPERTLEPIGVVADALVAVGARRSEDPLIVAYHAVDRLLTGGEEEAASLPDHLAAALSAEPAETWIGAEALSLNVDFGTALIAVEALVGHPDRLAVHFRTPEMLAPSAYDFIVSGTDDLGRGYVGHAESLGGIEHGAWHIRPPLPRTASRLTLHLDAGTHHATVDIDLTGSPK